MPARTLPPSLAAPQVYESRPVRIVAIQWRGDNFLTVREFLIHHFGASTHARIEGDAVVFELPNDLQPLIHMNQVIMVIPGTERPVSRIVDEAHFHATFKMVTP